MALNYSHRPIFSAHLSEDNLVSPIGISDRSGDGFVRREVQSCFDYGGETSGSSESKDIVDLLPSDPFGMDMSTTFTAISGWLEDLEVDYGGFGRSNMGANKEEYDLFAGLNLIWNSTVRFKTYSDNMQVDNKSHTSSQVEGYIVKQPGDDAMCESGSSSVCNVGDVENFDNVNSLVPGQQIEEMSEVGGNRSCGDGGAPSPALVFSLRFLGVQDLLTVEMVCKFLHSTVQNDPLLWRSIHIVDQPLNERLTDDALLQLTTKAQGNLQCLSLVDCQKITDDGLKRVLATNPKLSKLCIPGCTRVGIEGIVNSLKTFKSKATPGIQQLRIGGLHGVTDEHFEELKFLLGAHQQNGYRPHFFHRGNVYLLCDDDRPIDVEVCPRCEKLRLVYDCPAEGCKRTRTTMQLCRACTLCIARCIQCGRCIRDNEYEETFCLDFLCANCFKQRPRCQDREDQRVGGNTRNVFPQNSGHNSTCILHG